MGRAGALALAFRHEQRPDRVGVGLRARTATAAARFAVDGLPVQPAQGAQTPLCRRYAAKTSARVICSGIRIRLIRALE